jgi:metallo-beta-lactamase family protein
MVKVTCLGGAGTVTGSCFLLETLGGAKCLVDCGMFQGGRQLEELNREPWGFEPKSIQRVFLTHAHIDHSGRLPRLVKDGFSGPVLASKPTLELCEIMLLDSAHLQEMDALWRNKKNSLQKCLYFPLQTKPEKKNMNGFILAASNQWSVKIKYNRLFFHTNHYTTQT